MNRYFALSCILHLVLALTVVFVMDSAKKESKTTYTIDFIGSSKVVAMQNQAVAAQPETPPAAPKEEAPKEEPKPVKKAETKKAPKVYDSKSEISAEKQKKKKETPKPEPLAAPSVLDEAENNASKDTAASTPMDDGEGAFEGGNIQTDFATFPYPWYITQVRNSLWSEWEKRRPAGVTLRALISFAIDREGKIKNLKIENSSNDDSFDFSAKSAVINAGPFPPLPMLYEKDELTVTVEFKQEK